MKLNKVIRVFSVAFELYDLDKETKNKVKLKDIKKDFFSNEVLYKKNTNACKKENGKDVYTFIKDQCDADLKDYLMRIASRKHNVLTEKGRNGFINIGIESINSFPLDIRYNNKFNNYNVKILSVLHFNVENFYKYNKKKNDYNIYEKGKLKNVASFSFIIESSDYRQDEEILLNTSLKEMYVNLLQFENSSVKVENSSVKNTIELINGTIKDKEKKLLDKKLISPSNFYHDENNEPDYTRIKFRTFLLFYIWASFLGDFRGKIYESKEYKYTEPCRFVNAVTDLISFLSFESFSVSFYWPPQDELKADAKIFSKNDTSVGIQAINDWYDFLSDVFRRPSNEIWEKEFFRNKASELIKRDIEGAMYFQNIRVYPSYLDYYSAAITNKDFSKYNLRWDAAWGILLGDIFCTMAQTFITYNSKVEEHIKNYEKAKIMFGLLKKASFDFKNFYDADIVQKLELRNALEIAMETFLIKSHYDKMRERIRLFSDYEIEENEQKLNLLILIGGSVANILLASTLDFMLWIYHYHRIFRLAIPIEILSLFAFFIYYYLHQNTPRP